MIKNKKMLIKITSIISIIIIILGIGVFKYMKKKDMEQKLIEEFKPSMEIYLKTYYNNINSVTVNKVEKKPLGTELIGYVNGDKELRIFSFIDSIEENGEIKTVIQNVQVDAKLNDWEKEEYINSDKHYPAYELLEQQKSKEDKHK